MSDLNAQIPVLIVGGGVTGLSCAVFLAGHGIACTLVERHPGLLIHPRARGLTPRTMELYRQSGLESAIRDVAYAGGDFVWKPVKAATLDDGEYIEPDEPFEGDGSAESPTGFGPVDQDRLEAVLRDRALELGVDVRFGTELTSFQQDDQGVTARLADRTAGDAEYTVRAAYLVAADGFHSPVRTALGIELDGPGMLFHTITAIVDADLTPALRGRPVSIAYLDRPRPYTIMMAHGDGGRWVFGTGYDPSREALEDFTDERVAGMVREAAGLPDAEVAVRPQIPGTDLKVLGFPIGAHIARRFGEGRVFLAGDAAHAWPPTGGLGANSGIQDAHNLAWKLAEVLSGRAGAGLLGTYDTERRAVGTLTMEQALARFGTRMEPGDGPETGPGTGPEIIDYGAVAMGYRYDSAAVVGADGGTAPVPPAELDGRPGTRAPHADLGGGRSTLDRYGHAFVVVGDGDAWERAARDLGVEWGPSHGTVAEGAALLVRPDGFVAWRGTDPAALADALRAVRHLPVEQGGERVQVTPEGVRAAQVVVPHAGRPGVARLSFDNGLDRLALSARSGLGGLLEGDFGNPVPTVWSVDGKTHVEYPLGSRLFRRAAPSAVRIDPGVPWAVDVHGGAARLEADFTGVDLQSLAFHSGVAHVTITLGRPRGTRVVRLASAEDLTIVRPAGVPVRIEAAKGVTKVTLDDRSFGAVGNGLTDETPGYGTAEDRYLILVSGGVSGLTLAEADF
jgi:2-polyprenyl-6-methoxyphenol hydroxylase-like FAD-dependent oxidoreductase